MSAEIREHQTTLICSGVAVIAFGLWSIVRGMLWIFFNNTWSPDLIENGPTGVPAEVSANNVLSFAYVLIFVLVLLDLGFRIYIGLSAVSEGSGKHRRMTYVILSCLFLTVSLCGDLFLLVTTVSNDLAMETVASFVVEFSSLIAFFEIIRSSLIIRKYERVRGAEGEESHAG